MGPGSDCWSGHPAAILQTRCMWLGKFTQAPKGKKGCMKGCRPTLSKLNSRKAMLPLDPRLYNTFALHRQGQPGRPILLSHRTRWNPTVAHRNTPDFMFETSGGQVLVTIALQDKASCRPVMITDCRHHAGRAVSTVKDLILCGRVSKIVSFVVCGYQSVMFAANVHNFIRPQQVHGNRNAGTLTAGATKFAQSRA